MTQQAELLNEIEKIPQKYFGEVINFLGYLQHKALQEASNSEPEDACKRQESGECVIPLSTDSNGKFILTKELIDEMAKNSPTLHKLTGILHTDMTIDEIRMARLAKHL